MLKLGITGGIGSGKSVVSQLLELLGVPVFYADNESKILTNTSPVIREKLISIFGNEIYKGGVLNKPLLASHIFNDENKLKAVNAIIHPEVLKQFDYWVQSHNHSTIVAHEAAILFESGLNVYMDKVVLVSAPLDIRIDRVVKRDKATSQQVLKRIENQMSEEEKMNRADYIICNDGKNSLITQVIDLLTTLNYKIEE